MTPADELDRIVHEMRAYDRMFWMTVPTTQESEDYFEQVSARADAQVAASIAQWRAEREQGEDDGGDLLDQVSFWRARAADDKGLMKVPILTAEERAEVEDRLKEHVEWSVRQHLEKLDTPSRYKYRWIALENVGAKRDDLATHLRRLEGADANLPLARASEATTRCPSRIRDAALPEYGVTDVDEDALDMLRDEMWEWIRGDAASISEYESYADGALESWLDAEQQRLTEAGTPPFLSEADLREHFEYEYRAVHELAYGRDGLTPYLSTLSGKNHGLPFIVRFPETFTVEQIHQAQEAVFDAVHAEIQNHRETLWETFAATELGAEVEALRQHYIIILDALVRKHAERLGCDWYPTSDERLEQLIIEHAKQLSPELVASLTVDEGVVMGLLIPILGAEKGKWVEELERRQRDPSWR